MPINDFYLIPPYLIEQIEGRQYEVEQLYKLAPLITQTPDCILGVFVDDQHVIQGFMWAGINPLTLRLAVHALSVAPAYQGKGIVKEAFAILDKICREYNLKNYYGYTKNPEKFRSAGMKETGMIEVEK